MKCGALTPINVIAIAVAAGPIAFIVVLWLMPVYLAGIGWLGTTASKNVKLNTCRAAVTTLAFLTGGKIINKILGLFFAISVEFSNLCLLITEYNTAGGKRFYG